MLDHKTTDIYWSQNEDVKIRKKILDKDKNGDELLSLIRKLPECGDAIEKDIEDWMTVDEDTKMIDNNIVELVNRGYIDDEKDGDDPTAHRVTIYYKSCRGF